MASLILLYREGLFDTLHLIVWLPLQAARHWYTAWALLSWPAMVLLLFGFWDRDTGRFMFGAWVAWLAIIAAIELVGVSVAVFMGWASTDDVPSMVVSAFISSLVALPIATSITVRVFEQPMRPSARQL